MSAAAHDPAGWRGVAGWTTLGTIGCIAASLLFHALAFRNFEHDAFVQAVLSATILPLVLGAPLFLLLSLRLRDLRRSNHRLAVLASVDSLTECLNRGAFTKTVEHRLAQQGNTQGALLIVDADHFKAINDRFGHDHGDVALVLIARTMRSALRAGDVIGRLGGEEFGVLLCDVDRPTTEVIAERLRRAVNLAVFAPGGELRQLSVSVGGVFYSGAAAFDELFRLADRSLYEAKRFGRNRVEIVNTGDNDYSRRAAETAAARRLAAE